MREINLIVIHCSATRCNRDYPFERLDKDHRSRGWDGCGYHYYVTRDGRVHVGRSEERVGAHVGPKYNAHSIGVCYEGGLDAKGRPDDTRTDAQKRSMATLVRVLQRRYPKARILGHRDLPGVRKDCPCFDVRSDLAAVLEPLSADPEPVEGGDHPGGVNLPPIRGRPLPGLQNPALIRGSPLQGMQNPDWDLVRNYAGYAKPCRKSGHGNAGYAMRQTGFGSYFCRGCKTFPRSGADRCRVCKTFPVIQFIKVK